MSTDSLFSCSLCSQTPPPTPVCFALPSFTFSFACVNREAVNNLVSLYLSYKLHPFCEPHSGCRWKLSYSTTPLCIYHQSLCTSPFNFLISILLQTVLITGCICQKFVTKLNWCVHCSQFLIQKKF